MAQTRRRRRTKHRGNAAGVVETRGRTGRPASSDGAKAPARGPKGARPSRAAARANRYETPPTWRSAVSRALIAVLFGAVLFLAVFHQPVASVGLLVVFMLLVYVPMTYMLDQAMYRRYQRKKAEASGR